MAHTIDETKYTVYELDSEGIDLDQRQYLTIDDQPIIIVKVQGKLYAIGDICSHDDGPLDDGLIDDHCIVCPRHGAEFDIRTGEAKSMPAVVGIPVYPVQLDGNTLYLGIAK